MSGRARATARPCIVAMPTRSPVNEPGPTATASTSTSSGRRPAAASAVHQRRGQLRRWRYGRHRPSTRPASSPPRQDGARRRLRGGVERQRDHGTYAIIAMPAMHTVTPAMRQYLEAKRQHPTALVFFRMGDFYEMFYEDARGRRARARPDADVARQGRRRSGHPDVRRAVPRRRRLHRQLVSKGFRVAICEQVEDPKKAKGLVTPRGGARGVARHAHRRQLPRRARAAVPDGDRRRPASSRTGPASRRVRRGAASISRPASSAPPSTPGRGGIQALADELSVLRPREMLVPRGTIGGRDAFPRLRALGCRSPRPTKARSTSAPPSARCSSSSASRASTASACATASPPRAPPAACCGICGTRRKPTSATCRRWRSATAADALRIDAVTCRHLELIAGSEGQRRRLAAPRDRPHLERHGRPAAARLAAAAAGRAGANPRAAGRRRGTGVPDAASARCCARRWGRCRISSVCSAAWCWAPPDRGTSSPWRDRAASFRRSPRSWPTPRRPLVRSLLRRARRPCRRAAAHRTDAASTIRRPWHATAGSLATASTRRSTSCAPSAGPAGRSSPTWKRPSARAPASRR